MKNLQYANLPPAGGNFINIALGLIILFLIVWVLVIGQTVILPFMIALFLSFVLDPIVNLMQRIKIPTVIAVILTLILAFILLYLLGLLIYTSVQNFVNQLPIYLDRFQVLITDTVTKLESFLGQPINLRQWKNLEWLDEQRSFSIATNLLSSVGNFFTFVFKMFIVIIFIAYLLMGKRNINDKILRAFKQDQAERILDILGNVTKQVQKYIAAKTLISILTGFISIIVFYSFGLDFAIFWGFIIFLFNFIPNIGSIIATIMPALFSIVQFGSFAPAFWMLLIISLVQLLMGNLVEPRMMGRSLNLSPLMVILSLIFWGYIWGVVGMILAVPILGTITIVFENIKSLRFLSVFLRGKNAG